MRLTSLSVLTVRLMAFVYLTVRHGGIRLDCNGITRADRLFDGVLLQGHNGDWHFRGRLLFAFDCLACHVCKVRSQSLKDGRRQQGSS